MKKKLTKQWRQNPKFDFLNQLAEWKKKPAESDNKAPVINAPGFVKLRLLHQDAEVSNLRIFENKDLLKKNFGKLLTKGELDAFREPKTVVKMVRNIHAEELRLQEQLKENLRIFQRIHNVKGDIKKTSAKKLSLKCQQYRDYKRFTVPVKILEKYRGMKIPRGQLLFRLLRPRVWFELELLRVKPGQSYVGRFIVELYTEAAPLVVREFVDCCAHNRTELLKFVRLFPNLWLEGEIQLDEDQRIARDSFEYDIRALTHDTGGIISFPLEFVNGGFRYGLLSFTISSRPLSVLNGKRVAFGRIHHDSMKIMELLQEYGTKNGKLRKELQVTSCGVYK